MRLTSVRTQPKLGPLRNANIGMKSIVGGRY